MLVIPSQQIPSFQPPYENQTTLLDSRPESDKLTEQATLSNSRTESDEIPASIASLRESEQTPIQDKELTNRESTRIRLKELSFSSPVSRSLINMQIYMQKKGERRVMWVADSSELQHAKVCITPESFRVMKRLIGQGGQGQVYHVDRIFNDTNRPNVSEALKLSNTPPHSCCLMDEILSEKCPEINVPVQSYTVKSAEGDKHCDILPLATSDFSKFKFSNVTKPIQCMLNLLKDVAKGAHKLHQMNKLHRDIKPENILVLENGKRAQLADLDLICNVQDKEHFTCCTPIYAPTSIWGNDIIKQTLRRGRQTKADDVYSLGRTIQYGLISRIFAEHQESREYSNQIKPTKKVLKTTEEIEEIIATSQKSTNIFIVALTETFRDATGNNNTVPKVVCIYPPNDYLKERNFQGLKTLQSKLNPDEFEALNFATELAYNLQLENPRQRPSMERIIKEITWFQDNLAMSEPAAPVSAPLEVANIEASADAPPSSPPKKRIKTGHGEEL